MRVETQADATVIHAVIRPEFTPIQERLICGWLQYKGNVVAERGEQIYVKGQLNNGTISSSRFCGRISS